MVVSMDDEPSSSKLVTILPYEMDILLRSCSDSDSRFAHARQRSASSHLARLQQPSLRARLGSLRSRAKCVPCTSYSRAGFPAVCEAKIYLHW
eukprot:6174201-Pleurochrysis_carterae.AAC.1